VNATCGARNLGVHWWQSVACATCHPHGARGVKMGPVIRSLFVVVALVVAMITSGARAATYNIDATAPGGLPGTGGPIFLPICSSNCAMGFATSFYPFHPGDTVDLGTVILAPFIFCEGRNLTCALYAPSYQVEFSYPGYAPKPPITG
jgi:hypothetical protein